MAEVELGRDPLALPPDLRLLEDERLGDLGCGGRPPVKRP
jgi:hypothetical protein